MWKMLTFSSFVTVVRNLFFSFTACIFQTEVVAQNKTLKQDSRIFHSCIFHSRNFTALMKSRVFSYKGVQLKDFGTTQFSATDL